MSKETDPLVYDQDATSGLINQAAGEDALIDEVVKDSSLQSEYHVFFNIFKAVVGAGSFALPAGFAAGGIWGSIFGVIFIAVLSSYTIKILIRTKVHMKHTGSYPDLLFAALPHPYGTICRFISFWMIFILVMGACTVYLVFCGTLLVKLFNADSATWSIIGMGCVLALISWTPRLKEVAFFSLMGDVALLVAMGVVIAYGIVEFDLKPLSAYQQVPMSFKNFADFYGPVVFLFGVHILVVPLQQQMAKPEKFEKTLDVSLIVVVISNVMFALFAWMLYDAHVSSPITDSLCKNLHHIQNVAQVALIGDLIFTFSIVFVGGRDVVEALFFSTGDFTKKTHLKRMLIRTAMVALCTFLGALLVHKFGSLVNLISGTTFSALCFVFPPIIYLAGLWPYEYRTAKSTTWPLIICTLNVTIIFFGIFSAILTTQQAIAGLGAPEAQPCKAQ
mmetsp:Transcript_10590/g.17678  ORF Transcript_10590/g.17678 Transcript_10590/m.17678 type:complete len:447 (+) Transcript_10590:28-1368(+)